MRLLLDQNLSPRLCGDLQERFPGSVHVREVGLARADDIEVWSYAAKHSLTIVTKDSDFRQRSFLRGHPPKVVWIRLGNCSTKAIENLLKRHAAAIEEFEADPQKSFLCFP